MKTITITDLRRWGACYSDEELRALSQGRDDWTPLEIADREDIPVEDRIWALLRPEVLVDRLPEVIDTIVARAVENHALHCGITAVEAWAAKWLSGEDRTEAEAMAAARAAAWAEAMAAARAAAWAAARAARDAAWAAIDAAWDAASAAAGAAAWAARDAAWAAIDAAWDAAWAAERRLQLQNIRAALAEGVSDDAR